MPAMSARAGLSAATVRRWSGCRSCNARGRKSEASCSTSRRRANACVRTAHSVESSRRSNGGRFIARRRGMKRDQLEHVLRAAGAISGISTWVVVGSQAILGAVPDAPEELLVSQEVDLYAPGNEAASDLVDGSIGELSPFHQSFGYHAHGVGQETAILPSRWRARAIAIRTPLTGGVTGICPEPTDLAISKLAAWREKDQEFVRVLVQRKIVSMDAIRARLDEVDTDTATRIDERLRRL